MLTMSKHGSCRSCLTRCRSMRVTRWIAGWLSSNDRLPPFSFVSIPFIIPQRLLHTVEHLQSCPCSPCSPKPGSRQALLGCVSQGGSFSVIWLAGNAVASSPRMCVPAVPLQHVKDKLCLAYVDGWKIELHEHPQKSPKQCVPSEYGGLRK